jgi:hypothetical protein
MAALTFNTRYDTKKRKRVATGDTTSPAPVTAVPGKKLVTFVLIAAAVVIGYKLIKKSS